jgi:Carboxypeptidase regulatory-like domain
VARALCLLVACLFLTPWLSAQFSGAIQGTVVDSTRAAIPDAVVTATNRETGIARLAKTSNEGFYRISNLAPGTYSVKAEKPGFAASVLEGVVVDITRTVKADFNMAVGAVAEQVLVQAQAPVLETEQGRVSG